MLDLKPPRIEFKSRRQLQKEQKREVVYLIIMIIAFLALLGFVGNSDNNSKPESRRVHVEMSHF